MAWHRFAPLWVLALLLPAVAQEVTAPVATPVAVCGRVEQLGSLKLLRVWGSPDQRGYAHGYLMAAEVARVGIAEFTARFGSQPAMLELARRSVPRLIAMPDDVQAMLDGLYRGLLDSKVSLRMDKLDRDFDRTDLQIANALDVFGLMGCSGFTAWGDQVEGGGVLSARNFDWPFTGPHMVDGTILLLEHLPNGRAVCSVTWPGFVAVVTGISSEGLAAYLHVGTGKISMTPEPDSWPTAVAARAILATIPAGDAAAAFAQAQELLGHTSPPAGFITRLVLPTVPANGQPAAVFETDVKRCIQAEPFAGLCITTNHFAARTDGRPASADSRDREQQVRQQLEAALAQGRVTPATAWQALRSVERGGRRFGTLHALVFRHEPWCFELAIATVDGKDCVPAPKVAGRHLLTREQLFPAEVPAGPIPVGAEPASSAAPDAKNGR